MNEIVEVKPEEFGLSKNKAQELTKDLSTIRAERDILVNQYEAIIKKELSDEVMEEARALRLKIRDNRTKGINVWHKKNKAFYLAASNFIDATKRKELMPNEMMEARLKEIEDYYENLAKEKAEKLKKERVEAITPYIESEDDLAGVDLGAMTADIWDMFLAGKKQSFEKQQEEQRLAEEKAEEEARLLKLHNDRKDKLIPYWNFVETVPENLSKLSEKEFLALLEEGKDKKAVDDAEKEKLRKQAEKDRHRENEMKYLWKYANVDSVNDLSDKEFEKVLEDAKENRKKIAKRGRDILEVQNYFVGDYETMSDKEFNKALKEANSKKTKADEIERREQVLKPYWSYVNIDDVIDLSKTEFEKAVVKAKRLKDENEKRKEELAKKEAEKKALAQASDNKKILAFTSSLLELETPSVKEEKAVKVLENVKKLLIKIDNYAREQF